MSTSYFAVVVVGLPENELVDNTTLIEDLLYHEQVVTVFSSAYASNIVGIVVDKSGSFSYNQLDLDALDLACSIAKDEFKKLTGLDAKVYLSLDSY